MSSYWNYRECADHEQICGGTPDDIEADDGSCPFCGAILRGRPVCTNCDDEEVYCPECGYVEGVS